MLQHTYDHEVPLVATLRPATVVFISTVILVAAIYGPRTFSWPVFAVWAVLHYLFVGLGFSIGYHRGLIHRTYEASDFVRGVLALFGTLAGCQGPATTYKSHSIRSFYQNRSDPPPPFDYSGGYLRSAWYFLFVVAEPRNSPITDVPEDITGNRWMRFLDDYALALQGALFALMYAIGGWRLLVWGGFVRLGGTFVIYSLQDYIGHRHGYVRYPNHEASTPGYNSVVMGLLMLGEGWHNNHHAVPRSAKFGHAWWELDLAYAGLRVLEMVGAVRNLIVQTSVADPLHADKRVSHGTI